MSKKISQLPASTDVYDGCCMPIVTNDETKKMTYALLKEKLQDDLHLLDVDDALSESSENPVQNKVVTTKINEVNFKATQAVVAARNAASQAATASDSASSARNAAEEASGKFDELSETIDELSDDVTNQHIQFVDFKVETRHKLKDIDDEVRVLQEEIDLKITQPFVSNGGDIALSDSDNGAIRQMKVYGKSDQKTYSGKNLLNYYENTSILGLERNGDKFVNNRTDGNITEGVFTIRAYNSNKPSSGSDYRSIIETSTEKKYYYASFQKQSGFDWLCIKHNGHVTDLHVYFDISNFTNGETYTIGVNYIGTKPNEIGGFVFERPIIVSGNVVLTDDDFEPYVGGIPAPNPEFPQEIKSVEELNFDVCGKNLLDMSNHIQNAYIDYDNKKVMSISGADLYWMKVNKNTDYTISRDKGDRTFILGLDDEPTIGSTGVIIASEYSLTSPYTFNSGDSEYIAFYGNRYQDTKATWIQLEKGTVATPYEPYAGTTFKITPPRPLCKVGDIVDILDVESGVWKYGTGIVKGNSFIFTNVLLSEAYGNFVYMVNTSMRKAFVNRDIATVMCDKAISTSYNKRTENIDKYRIMVETSESLLFRVPVSENANFTTIQDFENVLKNDSTEFIYQLETPTTEPVNPYDLAFLRSLRTYYPATNISITDQNGEDITQEFLYKLKLENYIKKVTGQIIDTRKTIDDMQILSEDAYLLSAYNAVLLEEV